MATEMTLSGRSRELADVRRWLSNLTGQRGQVLLLAGEAGIGKSRLAAEAIAESGLTALTGRSRETSGAPYAPMTAVLRQCLRIVTEEFADAHPLGRYLGVLVPELDQPVDPPDRDTLVEAVAALMVQATRSQPAVIYLEDIQWADDATLELLPSLVDRLRDVSIAILATYRSDEITRTHPLRRFRNELRRMRQLHEIVLSPLSQEATAEILGKILDGQPSTDLAATVHQRSQGVPLYIEELARSLLDKQLIRRGLGGYELDPDVRLPLPESVRDAILLRTERLSRPARELLETAAVLGDDFSFDELTTIAGTDDGLAKLIEQQFIVESSPGCGRFRHGLIGETVASEMTWTRRRELHRTVAEHLSDCGAPPGVLSQHWLQAGEQDRARHTLVEAADQSCRIHAYRDAVRAVNQALEIWPDNTDESLRLTALRRLARCAMMSGQHSAAIRALSELLESGDESLSVDERVDLLRQLATAYGLQGAWEKSIQIRLDAAEVLLSNGTPGEAAAELLAAGSRMVATSQLERAIETLNRASALAAEGGQWDVASRAMGLMGNVTAMTGDAEAGTRIAREALNLALERNLPQAASDVYRRLASSLEYGSHYAQARETYYEALNYCRTQKADTEAHICLSCMSALLFWTGDLKEAVEMCRATLQSDHSPEGSKATAEGTLGVINAFRGEVRQARSRLSKTLSTAKQLRIAAMELICLWALAVVEDNSGNTDAAALRYSELLDRWEATQDRHDAIPALAFATVFFSRHANNDEIVRCTTALETIAADTDNPEALAALSIALGEGSLMSGNTSEAVRHLKQAEEHVRTVDMPLLHIVTRYRLGVALARSGDCDNAIASLDRAHHDARRLGFRPLAADIAAELTDIGGAVPRDADSDNSITDPVNPLTSRQQEIIQFLADGMSNKDIAERLYVSVRTVDMHVRNILDRLDCRSRSEAVKKAGQQGILK